MANKQKGLTLIELMVTLVVAIILVSIGMPLFTGVVENNRATAQTNGLVAALQLARSEAVKRGVVVRVCADDAGECGDDLADWPNGWFVHLDLDGDGNVDAADGEVLRRWDAVTPDVALTVTGAATVVYQPAGAVDAPTSFEIAQPEATVVRPRRCLRVAGAGGINMRREEAPLPNDEWACGE
jgi:type IV fimbrial biogenesis protein FimT